MPEQTEAHRPTYAVRISPAAWQVIMALPQRTQERIFNAIEALEVEPRPGNAKPLKREWRGYWRVRSGNYRVIYTIEENRLVVVVVKVGNRKDVY
jgi:mRNA interferase RelE/StbE